MSGPRIPIPCIVGKSQLDLGNHGIRLYGQDDEIIFTFTDTSPAPRFKVNPIRYFLTYVSFMDWNIIGPLSSDVVKSDYVVMGSMTFKLLEDESQREIVVTRDQVVEFLDLLNPTLYNAMASYLIGCEFHRYFLIYYFKAAEIIENELGGERKLISTLSPYGVTATKYKEFKRLCNGFGVRHK